MGKLAVQKAIDISMLPNASRTRNVRCQTSGGHSIGFSLRCWCRQGLCLLDVVPVVCATWLHLAPGDSGSPFRVRPLLWSDGQQHYVHERNVGTQQVPWTGVAGGQFWHVLHDAQKQPPLSECFPSSMHTKSAFR